jgi:hypothetical protein
MNIPVLTVIVILILLLIISLWREAFPKFALVQQLLLTWLIIALLRLLGLPV